MNSRTLLVDGTNIAMFASFGGKVDPSQSTFSALGCIETAARKVEAETVIVALDGQGPTFRKQLNATYKAGRTTNTQPYVDKLRERCAQRGWATVTVEGFEADDVLASLATQRPGRHFILSNDSDVLALVTPFVSVLRPKKVRETVEWGVSAVTAYYCVEPSQLPLYKALVGEPGDNIAGVIGIGPKKAVAMIMDRTTDWRAFDAHLRATLPLTTLRTDVPLP